MKKLTSQKHVKALWEAFDELRKEVRILRAKNKLLERMVA